MKTRVPVYCALLTTALLSLGGCKKDSSTDPSDSVSDADLADGVAATLGGNQSTFGVSAQIEQAASVAGGGGLHKVAAPQDTVIGIVDTTISRIGVYNFHYDFHFAWMLPNLNRLQFTYTMSGNCSTPRITSTDSALANWVVTGLLTGTAFRLDGSYERMGSQVSRVRSFARFSTHCWLNFTAVMVDKQTKKITSGSCNVQISGKGSDGLSFTRTGTVTFTGSGRGTFTIGGKTFNLDLLLGEAVAV